MKTKVSKRDFSRFFSCLDYAKKSNCAYQHAASIYRGPVRIAIGNNYYNPEFKLSGNRKPMSVHAEEKCIIQSWVYKNKYENTILYSARSIKDNGRIYGGISKPCTKCTRLINIAKIKWIVYCDGINLIKEKLF